jgi:hypothetical protein
MKTKENRHAGKQAKAQAQAASGLVIRIVKAVAQFMIA